MTRHPLPMVAAAGCMALAWVAAPPQPAVGQELAAAFVRPAMLPFVWSSLEEAGRTGDDAEYFARARQLLELMPAWTDGHTVFAFRLALAPAPADATDPGGDAWQRLQVALAWLEGARATAGTREADLLLTMAFLPEVAVLQQPALGERLRASGGPAALADHYLAAAEQLRGSPAVREARTFLAPKLAAGLLAAGDRRQAMAVLDTAIERSFDVRDRALAGEWRQRLLEVRRWLDGDRAVDLAAVQADERFAALWAHLR
ncbi:MAG: hypothetical protein KF830_02545 [Planctomycetes bacterium]|nr:hypothetical protein [Planctomycetota bacterium]